jgi:hypothetical protein
MLHLLICSSTSGQTEACCFLYSSRNSGLSLTIWAKRLAGTFWRADDGAKSCKSDTLLHVVGVCGRGDQRPKLVGEVGSWAEKQLPQLAARIRGDHIFAVSEDFVSMASSVKPQTRKRRETLLVS